MKKQLKAIEDNSSIQSENNFQSKSEPSYLAETNMSIYKNWGRFNNNRRGGNNYNSRGSRQGQSYNSNIGLN